jgi:hypothetical protein
MSEIAWPEGYLPGTTDNYVSNEVIVAGLSAAQAWSCLDDTSLWPTYYANASEIRFHDGSGPRLSRRARFRITTFGFPVEAEVTEYEPPAEGRPRRVAWHGWVEGDAVTRLDVHHAWLFQDLPGGRVRILTQETQNGGPGARDDRHQAQPHAQRPPGLAGRTGPHRHREGARMRGAARILIVTTSHAAIATPGAPRACGSKS